MAATIDAFFLLQMSALAKSLCAPTNCKRRLLPARKRVAYETSTQNQPDSFASSIGSELSPPPQHNRADILHIRYAYSRNVLPQRKSSRTSEQFRIQRFSSFRYTFIHRVVLAQTGLHEDIKYLSISLNSAYLRRNDSFWVSTPRRHLNTTESHLRCSIRKVGQQLIVLKNVTEYGYA